MFVVHISTRVPRWDSSGRPPVVLPKRDTPFLETLYFVRGEIVHSDFQVERILNKIENHDYYELSTLDSPTEREYVQEARVFLAAVLREYMGVNVAHDIIIADLNRGMDEAARNVSFSP